MMFDEKYRDECEKAVEALPARFKKSYRDRLSTWKAPLHWGWDTTSEYERMKSLNAHPTVIAEIAKYREGLSDLEKSKEAATERLMECLLSRTECPRLRWDIIRGDYLLEFRARGAWICRTIDHHTIRNYKEFDIEKLLEAEVIKQLQDILKGEYQAPHVSIWHYKLDDLEEVGDPSTWLKANPNLGITVSYETYHLDVERAEKAPASRNDILAKRFGIPMEGYTYFFTYEETIPHRKSEFWGLPASMGADLSQGDDFCAFTLLFPLGGEKYGVKTRSYITERTLNLLPAAMRQKYEEFINEGSLHIMPGTVLDMMEVYDDLEAFLIQNEYDVRTLGFDPYNAKEFVARWEAENGPFGIEKVLQGAKTESVPLGELKKLSEDRMLIFDQQLMMFAMGNAITLEDTNGNRKLLKKRQDEKIDNVSALMDAYVAYKLNKETFE